MEYKEMCDRYSISITDLGQYLQEETFLCMHWSMHRTYARLLYIQITMLNTVGSLATITNKKTIRTFLALTLAYNAFLNTHHISAHGSQLDGRSTSHCNVATYALRASVKFSDLPFPQVDVTLRDGLRNVSSVSNNRLDLALSRPSTHEYLPPLNMTGGDSLRHLPPFRLFISTTISIHI